MFEKLLSRGERRFGRYFGIPKLMMILCIGMGVTYVADYLLAAYNISLSYYLMFDRGAIFHGQIWRLVSFIFMPPSSSPVFLLISLMFYWYLGTSLQNTWYVPVHGILPLRNARRDSRRSDYWLCDEHLPQSVAISGVRRPLSGDRGQPDYHSG